MSNSNFYKYNFLTNKAFEYQSKIMSGKTMTFTRVEIGDGILSDDENLEDIMSLKNKITDVKILSVVPKGHMVELTILLDGEGLEEVTLYREIGIYAQIDEEEALYAYLNSDDKFDYIIPLNEGEQREFTNNKIKITLVVGNADNINVTLNNTTIPDNSITLDMLNIEVKNYIEDIKNIFNQKNQEIESNLNENISKISEHKQRSVLNSDGVHDFKCNGDEIFCYDNSNWRNIDVTAKHRGTRITGGDGVHGIRYDLSDKRLKYKNNSNIWENIPTGQNAESLINTHKSKSILNEDGAHDLKYDKESNKFKYKESESWHDINTGQEVKQELNTHKEKKVSDVDGVHGITFIEEEDLLRITKQDGQVSNYKAGVDPDLLFSDLNTGLDNCIEKVGRTNE